MEPAEKSDALARARAFARERHAEATEMLRELAAIGAPTRHEQARADWVCEWVFAQTGGEADVAIDDALNVVWHIPAPTHGLAPSHDPAPTRDSATDGALVISAHTDVVFDDERHVVREEAGRMYAPGVGDDTANLVVMLLVARDLWLSRSHLERDVIAVANSCEEGLGNLDGTKALYEREADRVGEHVAFDVHLGEVVGLAVGSHRWRLGVSCAGGHSYFDFGAPNAILELSRLIEGLYDLERGASTTVNVGRIEGGTTVNAIAASASALVEYRSTSEAELAAMRSGLESLVEAAMRPGVDVMLEEIGVRPGAAGVDERAQRALVSRALAAYRATCDETVEPESASTDANVPLSLGIPAICVGTVAGEGMHTRGEWVDLASLGRGLALAHLLVYGEAAPATP